jgi:hypothetical protein
MSRKVGPSRTIREDSGFHQEARLRVCDKTLWNSDQLHVQYWKPGHSPTSFKMFVISTKLSRDPKMDDAVDSITNNDSVGSQICLLLFVSLLTDT